MTVKCSCITFLNQLHVFPSAYMYYEGWTFREKNFWVALWKMGKFRKFLISNHVMTMKVKVIQFACYNMVPFLYATERLI